MRENGRRDSGWLGYALTTAAIWLGWQTALSPILDRAPPALALRLAPSSAEVLQRAAEAELAAKRPDNASALAGEALTRAPFSARALRVRGLADAETKHSDAADQILTLAGNWSLRDDPTHAWLVERRLRQGNYKSSLAHADTLARRRKDIHPQVFNLFTTAANADPRAVSALAELLAIQPPWRDDYLAFLYERPEGPKVLLSLALSLENTPGRFKPYELERLYSTWSAEGRLTAVRFLRDRIDRPSTRARLQNGDFSTPAADQILPFGWRLGMGPGLNVEMVEDDVRDGDMALRVDYDGYGTGLPLQQLVTLPSGPHVFTGQLRFEVQPKSARLAWTISCANNGERLLNFMLPVSTRAAPGRWLTFSQSFTVPQDCIGQWLRLEPRAGDARSESVIWLDKLSIATGRPAGGA